MKGGERLESCDVGGESEFSVANHEWGEWIGLVQGDIVALDKGTAVNRRIWFCTPANLGSGQTVADQPQDEKYDDRPSLAGVEWGNLVHGSVRS